MGRHRYAGRLLDMLEVAESPRRHDDPRVLGRLAGSGWALYPSSVPLEGEYEPSPQDWVRDQVKRYEDSGGREANTFRDTGFPVVIFSTRGATSGKIRKQPLMRVEYEGAYAMVASLGGAAADPVWVQNVRTHPEEVAVQDGPNPWDGFARELHGEERAVWWKRAVATYPRYAELQRKTDRLFSIFVVERRGG